MQIFVGNKAYQVDHDVSLETLMAMVENREFLPAGSFALKSTKTGILESLNGISEDEELEVTLAVPAGMRKKWRKKRMRRLRRKRRKMRQRAR
jgi:small subunit ribosomal protein S27Ae